MRVRRVAEELEARLVATDGSGARGKAEWRRYADGTIRLDLRLRGVDGLDGPDGTAEVRIAGASLAASVAGGTVSLEVDSLPVIPAAGDEVEVVVGGVVRASGRLVPD